MATATPPDQIDVRKEVKQTLDQLMPWAISFLVHLSIGLIVLFALAVLPQLVEPEAQVDPTRLFEINKQVGLTASVTVGDAFNAVAVNVPRTQTQLTMPDPLNALSVEGPFALPDGPKARPEGLVNRTKGKFFGTGPGKDEIDENGGRPGSVVFVIDASGSMVEKFSNVQTELILAVNQLDPQVHLNVIFFQQDTAQLVLPRGLLPATRATKARLIERLSPDARFVQPRGSSNPLPAMKTALSLRPDRIIVLSDNITGAGAYQVELNALLEQVNEYRRRFGAQRTQIHTVQFLRPDPQHALRRLAQENGGSYRFVAADALD